MTWTEAAVWFLAAERAFAMSVGFYRGARAAWRASEVPQWRADAASTTMPDQVEIASNDAVSLDYSSGAKRH